MLLLNYIRGFLGIIILKQRLYVRNEGSAQIIIHPIQDVIGYFRVDSLSSILNIGFIVGTYDTIKYCGNNWIKIKSFNFQTFVIASRLCVILIYFNIVL